MARAALFALSAALFSYIRGAWAAQCFDGAGSFAQAKWPFCMQLAADVLMYYGPDSTGNYMKLGLFVENHAGWSALALGGNGGMKGAQQFVVRKDGGQFVAEERYSADYTTPQLQPTQEVSLIFASEDNGNIAWGVLVPMESCSAGNRYPIEDVSKFMHWGLGSTHDFTYHSRRGQFHANLVSGPTTMEDTSSWQTADVHMPNVSVVMGAGGSDAKNPYICGIFDLGEFLPAGQDINSKLHVAKFSAILDPDSWQYVHHMILYACSSDRGFTHGQVIEECESMPPGCNSMRWPWAMGSEPLEFPSDVGMPFGSGARWYALQMHYYNPSLHSGVMDASGVRLTFAPAVRTYDAGVMRFNGGTDDDMRDPIPPGEADYTLPEAVMPSACTAEWAVSEVNVLGVVHHAHLVGKKINIDVVRGDAYVGALRREHLYDFNHQSAEPPSVKKIQRGDDMVMRCTYDTSGKTTPTAFGDFTQTEMCWAAILYYPEQRVDRAVISKVEGDGRLTWCPNKGVVQSYVPRPTMPACQAKGYLWSAEAYQVLSDMGLDTSSWTTRTTTPAGSSTSSVAGSVTMTTSTDGLSHAGRSAALGASVLMALALLAP